MQRANNREFDQLRPVTITRNFIHHAEGSCLIEFGATRVICTASLEDKPPPWMRGENRGWVSAEYGMLPRATHTRTPREVGKGKPAARTVEIQRLIGRSLRSVVDLAKLGTRTVWIDCDVIQADGGTRTASITGGFIALRDLCANLVSRGVLADSPLRDHVAAVSCGVTKTGEILLDLDYSEDSACATDMNFVITGTGKFVEIQGTAEGAPFDRAAFDQMERLAQRGVAELIAIQRALYPGG